MKKQKCDPRQTKLPFKPKISLPTSPLPDLPAPALTLIAKFLEASATPAPQSASLGPVANWAPLCAFRRVSRAWRDAARLELRCPFGWLSLAKARAPVGCWVDAPIAKLMMKVHSRDLGTVRDVDEWRQQQEAQLKDRYPHLQAVQWHLEEPWELVAGRLNFNIPVRKPEDACLVDYYDESSDEYSTSAVPAFVLEATMFPESRIRVNASTADEDEEMWPLQLRGPLTLGGFFRQLLQAGAKNGEDLWTSWVEDYTRDGVPPRATGIERLQQGEYMLDVQIEPS